MFFKINKVEDEYHVLFSSGQVKYFDDTNIGAFLSHYDESIKNLEDGVSENFEDYYGNTVAILDSNRDLIIKDASLLRCVAYPSEFPYYTASEYAELNERKTAIVLRHCREGRIPGVVHIGSLWLIPKGTPYPKDNRAGRDMSKRDYHVKRKK